MMNSPNHTPDSFPDCPTSLNAAQLAGYHEHGFLAFENALLPEEVEAAREALSALIRDHAFNDALSTYQPPNKSDSQPGAVFRSRKSRLMFQLEADFVPSPERLDEIESKVRKFMWFEDEAPIFRSIYTAHARIQGVVRSILGPEIALYQSMALTKPAHIGSEKPWHQDNAYFSVEDTDAMLGTWIALDDVGVENGAMHFLPGCHRGGPLKHHHTHDCEIVPDRLSPEQAVPICLKAGGMVVFHGNLPHFTPANTSPYRRRALQYHYRCASNRMVSKEEYDKVFKEQDGTPASCAAAIPENF